MTGLRCTLYLLKALTICFGLNFFTYDRRRGRFRRRTKLYAWLRLLYILLLLLIVPFIVVLFLLVAIPIVGRLITTLNLQGSQGLWLLYDLAFLVTVATRLCLYIYIAYLVVLRSAKLQHMLNLFASVYAGYRRLFGSNLPMRWWLLATLCGASISAFLVVFCLSFWTRFSPLGRVLVALYSLQSLLLTLLCNFGLALLNACFRGVKRHMHPTAAEAPKCCWPHNETLRFIDALMRLRVDFGAFASIVFICELLLNLTWSTIFMHYYMVWQKTSYFCLLFLIYPFCYTNLSHDICDIPLFLGAELMQCDVSDNVDTSSDDDFLRYFCWHRLLIAPKFSSSFEMLHLRKDYLLEFMDMVFVNGMFLNSILIVLAFEFKVN